MDVLRMSLQWGKRFALCTAVLTLVACGAGGSGYGGSSGGGGGSTPTGTRTGTLATGSYTISWTAVSDSSVTGYRVYFDYTPIGSGRTPSHVDVTSPTVSLQPGSYGLFQGETMYVAVASTGANGLESPVGSQVSIVLE